MLRKKKHSHRLADHETPPDHDGSAAAQRNLIIPKHRDHRLRGARRKSGSLPGIHRRHGPRRHTVHILLRKDDGTGCLLVERLRKRAEHQNPVHGAVFIQVLNPAKKLCLADILRQQNLPDLDAIGGAAFHRSSFIREIL